MADSRINISEIKLDYERFKYMSRISSELLTDIKLDIIRNHFTDEFTIHADAFFLKHSADKLELIYYAPKPKFLDWLLGRTKKVTFDLFVWDIVFNPPRYAKSKRIFYPVINENRT